MIRDVCYHDQPCTEEDRLFQITAFRTFSKTATWATIRDILGRYPTLDDLADGAFGSALDQARERNGGLYTGAFILCATDAYGQSSKHRNHVELFRHMFLHDQLGTRLMEARSLREVYGLLHGYPLMGDFMSYQTSIDLNYSALINFSENEFTQAGPGALRGIRKCFDDLGDYTPAEIVLWMTDRQEDELARLGLPFGGLWGTSPARHRLPGPVLRDRQVLPRGRPRTRQRPQAHQSQVHPHPRTRPPVLPAQMAHQCQAARRAGIQRHHAGQARTGSLVLTAAAPAGDEQQCPARPQLKDPGRKTAPLPMP
jgi:hypothetical protein